MELPTKEDMSRNADWDFSTLINQWWRYENQVIAIRSALPSWIRRAVYAETEVKRLKDAIALHHSQKADDRCIEDDDRLYESAGLPPCDRRVGNKEEMLENCKRFIENRCESGGWPTYAELETKVKDLQEQLEIQRYEHLEYIKRLENG